MSTRQELRSKRIYVVRRRRAVASAVAAVVALFVAYFVFDITDVLPGPLTTAPPIEVQAVPHPDPARPEVPRAQPLSDQAPVPGDLAGRVDPIFDSAPDPQNYSAEVRDAATGQVLYSRAADTPRTPASVTKVLTATAALGALGPSTTFSTQVVTDGTGSDIYLKGGGDVLLGTGESQPDQIRGHAGLTTLAAATAAALKDKGVTSVTVHVDTSRYQGENFRSQWERADIGNGYIAPIEPLMVNAGLTSVKVAGSPREVEPANRAAEQFAQTLSKQGLKAQFADPATAPENAEVIASVESAPLASVVRYMLLHSDNVVAETLAVEVAKARGGTASLEASSQAVLDQLKDMNLSTGSITLGDTSGLNYDNRISPHDLTEIFTQAAIRDDLSELIPNMPVGGLSGTLFERYQDAETRDGAGMVSAKTGTLATVSSLAGTVLTTDGRLLTFTFMADGLQRGSTGVARQIMDRAVTSLAECGC